MRTLFASLSLAAFVVFGAPVALGHELPTLPVGAWRYEGAYRPLQVEARETVNATTDAGRARIAELRGRGFDCSAPTGGLVSCRAFLREIPAKISPRVPGDVAKEVHDSIGGGPVVFESAPTRIEVSSDAPALTVFHVFQPVIIDRARIGEFDYYELRDRNGGTVSKLRLRDDLWLLTDRSGKALSLPVTIRYSSGPLSWRILAEAALVRRSAR